MGKSKSPKWIIGLTGTALSAFVFSQIAANQPGDTELSVEKAVMNTMSNEEKELVQLDWTNYTINGMVSMKGVVKSDRQTRRT